MNRAAEADAIKKHLSLFIPNLSPPNVFTGGPAGVSSEAWDSIDSFLSRSNERQHPSTV